jgi:hypothetical protein
MEAFGGGGAVGDLVALGFFCAVVLPTGRVLGGRFRTTRWFVVAAAVLVYADHAFPWLVGGPPYRYEPGCCSSASR